VTRQVVTQGECFHSLAERYGFADPSTIADDGANAELRRSRDVLGILRPGDQVTIPPRTSEEHSCAGGATHGFQKKGKPPVVKLKLLDRHGQPRAGLKYELAFDDIVKRGATDGGGFLTEKIPPRAELARLTLIDGDDREVMELALGHVDPIDDDAGVQQRLANLGFDDGTEHGEWTESKRALLRAFQSSAGLDPRGELDAPTRDALKQKHGC
jgi:N-acetylmuramoyl-L-alanine amidase